MKKLRFIAILFVGILLFASVISPATTVKADDPTLLDRALVAIFEKTQIFGIPWFMFRFADPPRFSMDPSSTEIEYLNSTKITIGMKDAETGEYVKTKDLPVPPLFEGMDYTFELKIPDHLPQDAFIAHFSPQLILQGEGDGEMKTELTLTSNIPKDASLPSAILLQIKIIRWTTAGNLYLPPKGERWPFVINSLGWFLAATGITNPANPFGKLYSGKRTTTEDEISYIDLLVRVNRFHLLEITPPKQMEIEPNEILPIPIQVQNLGSHVDTFSFNITTSAVSQLKVTAPPSITLGPNEVGHTTISVASPLSFQDPGTLHAINIEAYSIYDSEKVFSNSVTLITRGVYLSEMNATYSAFTGIIILLGIAFFLHRRKRKLEKFCKKPEKPWNIPDENKALEKLKETDKKEYNKVFGMMSEEYQSSLLWYKHYRKEMLAKHYEKISLRNSVKQIMGEITNSFKIPSKLDWLKKKDIKKLLIKLKPEVKKAPKTKEIPSAKTAEIEQKAMIDSKAEQEKLRREKLLLKIKRKQEKQRRKFKQSIY